MVDVLSKNVRLLTSSQFYNAQILFKNLTYREKNIVRNSLGVVRRFPTLNNRGENGKSRKRG